MVAIGKTIRKIVFTVSLIPMGALNFALAENIASIGNITENPNASKSASYTDAELEAAEAARKSAASQAALINTNRVQNASDIATQAGNSASKNSSNQAMQSTVFMGGSMAAMGMYMSSCSGAGATCNYGFLATSIALSVFSGLAGSNSGKAGQMANASYGIVDNTSGNGSGVSPNAYANCTSVECIYSNTSGGDKAIAANNSLKKAGLVTGLNKSIYKGKTYTAEDVQNGKLYSDLGLSAAQAAAANASLKSALDEANKAGNAFADALAKKAAAAAGLNSGTQTADFAASANGTGGGQAKSGADNVTGIGMDLGPDGKPKLGSGNLARQVAGLTKNVGGTIMGVAEDHLFEMMNRRYEKQDKDGSFISKKQP